jgi:hypothetical protein
LTVTDERGRRRTFELTPLLAEHLQWLLSVRRPLTADDLLMAKEIAEQPGRGKDAGASE